MVYKDAGKIFNGERLKHNLNYIFSFMINNKTVRLIFKPVNLGVDDYDKLLKSHTKVEIIEIDFEHYT